MAILSNMETLHQKKAAEFLGVSPGYLSKILNGKSSPRKDILKALSDKTGSDANVWMFGTREEKETAILSSMNSQVAI